jgi:O-antigen/teichoic acid export membrane protein
MRFSKSSNYIVTFFVEFLVLLLGFLVFRLASEKLAEVGFSEFTLARRNISFLQPLLMLGLGVAVPRYMSINKDRDSYLPSGLMMMMGIGILFLLALFAFRNVISILFFGNAEYNFLILPLALLLVTYGFHSIIYGYLRGKGEMYLANVFQLINIGIVPVLIMFFAQDVAFYMYFSALTIGIVSVVFSVLIFLKNQIKFNRSLLKEDSMELLGYGMPRIFGDFALLALLTIPAYVVLYLQHNLSAGGDIAYAITLFNLVGAAFGPISLVLLPEISKFLVESRIDLISKRFYFFVFSSLLLTVAGYLIFILFHESILNLLLGKNYRHEIFEIARVILLGSFGYVMYIVLRSFLDAIHVKAKNSVNLLISLGVYTVMILCGYLNGVSMFYYLYSFVIAVNLLGVLTFIQTYYSIKKLK